MFNYIFVCVNQFCYLLRLTPFDGDTAEGRANERHRRLLLTSATSVLAKVTAALVTLTLVPVTLGYLGNERFGIWIAISSAIAMLGFADLGIGYGVLNSISEAFGKGDLRIVRQYISGAFAMLISLAILTAIVFLVVQPFVSWPRFFNVMDSSTSLETTATVHVLFFCFILSIPLNSIQRIQLALQHGYIANLWMTAGSFFSLGAMFLVVYYGLSLPWLAMAVAATPLAISLANAVHFFCIKHPELLPRPKYISHKAIKKLMKIGFQFLILQAVVAIAFSSDNLIIARFINPEQVTEYSIPVQMFDILGVALSIILMPLWPVYGEAHARGDTAWMRKTLLRSIRYAILVTGVGAITLVMFGHEIINLWVGSKVNPSWILLVGLGVWATVRAIGDCLGTFMNGIGAIRFQITIALLFAFVCVSLKIFFIINFGIAGVPWATLIAYCSISLTASIIYLRNFFINQSK